MRDARDVILEPIVSEKSFTLLEQNVYTFKVHPSSSKPEIAKAIEQIFDVQVLKVNTLRRQRQAHPQPASAHLRTPPRHQTGHGHPRRGRLHRAVRGVRREATQAMSIRRRKPTSPGRRFQTSHDFSEITRSTPREVAAGTATLNRGPQQRGPQDGTSPGRRSQAPLPDHRLPPPQGRRSGQGGVHRVRPQPELPHRPAALLRRGEVLHPGARRQSPSATCWSRELGWRSARATPCRFDTSRSARSFTTWS